MRTSKRIASIAAIAAVSIGAGLSVTACSVGTPQLDDLKNVQPVYPDYAVTVMNVDGFPNVTLLCYDDVAMITTTRDYQQVQSWPVFDNICKAHDRNDINPANGFNPPAEG